MSRSYHTYRGREPITEQTFLRSYELRDASPIAGGGMQATLVAESLIDAGADDPAIRANGQYWQESYADWHGILWWDSNWGVIIRADLLDAQRWPRELDDDEPAHVQRRAELEAEFPEVDIDNLLDVVENIRDNFERLEDYWLLDEGLYEELQRNAEEEAWASWGQREFQKLLVEVLRGYFETDEDFEQFEDDVEDTNLGDLYISLGGNLFSVYPEVEDGSSVSFRLDRWVEALTGSFAGLYAYSPPLGELLLDGFIGALTQPNFDMRRFHYANDLYRLVQLGEQFEDLWRRSQTTGSRSTGVRHDQLLEAGPEKILAAYESGRLQRWLQEGGALGGFINNFGRKS